MKISKTQQTISANCYQVARDLEGQIKGDWDVIETRSFYLKKVSTTMANNYAVFDIFDNRLGDTATGCGYDKESTALVSFIANLLSSFDNLSIDRKIYLRSSVQRYAGVGFNSLAGFLENAGIKISKTYTNKKGELYRIRISKEGTIYNDIKRNMEKAQLDLIVNTASGSKEDAIRL